MLFAIVYALSFVAVLTMILQVLVVLFDALTDDALDATPEMIPTEVAPLQSKGVSLSIVSGPALFDSIEVRSLV